ncbi:hypothetical protein EVAR_13828_1 [Eumeta japonica]|uniref:Uncharacterized protein n=1 Tax=Eumeta variegata TaxID=151549 RepID=A0A4C1U195_EUMVA|nr:hypothetical protein EVAR_13828_1 [Eumeta japonica]
MRVSVQGIINLNTDALYTNSPAGEVKLEPFLHPLYREPTACRGAEGGPHQSLNMRIIYRIIIELVLYPRMRGDIT